MTTIDENPKNFRALFLEIAIIEHLFRNRANSLQRHELTAGEFGILNYFQRNRVLEEWEHTLAWSFQDEPNHMAAKITGLGEKGHVVAEGEPLKRKVVITEAGQIARGRAMDLMEHEMRPLLAHFDPDEVKAALVVLQELRRTLDNLPDR